MVVFVNGVPGALGGLAKLPVPGTPKREFEPNKKIKALISRKLTKGDQDVSSRFDVDNFRFYQKFQHLVDKGIEVTWAWAVADSYRAINSGG